MANNDIEIKVVVDAKGAVTALNDVGEEIKRVESATSDGERGFSKFQAAIVTVNQTVELAKNAFSAMTGAVGTVFGALERGSTVGDIAESFGQLSEKAGAVSDVFLGELQQATAGTVSNFDLMRKSNELLNAGLKPDAIITFSKAARAFGEQDGKSFEETLQGITDSVLRGNDRFLKSKGIILDLTKAYDEYAASVGKTTAEVTESERAEIARSLAIDALNKKLKETGEIQVDTGDAIAQIRTVFVNAYDDMTKAIAGDKGTLKFLKEFAQGLQIIIPKAVNTATASLNTLSKILDGTDDAFKNGLKVIGNWANNLVLSGGHIRSLDIAIAQTRKEIEQQTEAVQTTTQSFDDWLETLPYVDTSVYNVGNTSDEAAKKIAALSTSTEKAASNAEQLKERMLEANAAAHRFAKNGMAEISSSIDGAFSAAQGKQGGSSILDQLFTPSGGDKSAYDQAASNAFLMLAEGIDNAKTGKDGKELVKRIDEALYTAWGASLGGPVGAVIGNIVGRIAGQIDAKIYDVIATAFGHGADSAGTQMRKQADKFFADAFDANRLQLVINGQLQQITDLQFTGNQTGGLFASLEEETRKTFEAVGFAFESLLEIASDVGVNIGAVLANNIGGSLNNLQLLVQASGVSFEQLRTQVVEAFLDGKISALEAQSALKGIEQIAQKGIPDGIGFTVQAFENMLAAGSKGGRALVDALGDIGAEAAELNIKTFPELMANLAASGKFSQEQIEQVFNALAANGIDSVEELTNATEEQLLPVLAQLEESGFLTEAAQEVSDIVTTLERLPTRKDVEINLRVNASQADRTILNQVSGGQLGGGGQGLGFTQ